MKITKINAASTYAKTKLRVAAYARVSTGSDAQEESLSIQKEHYESFIKSNPEWEFAGIYFDEAISGTKTEKREGLKKMLKDAENGKIDRILVKSISRFSRNTVRTLQMVRRLNQLKVSIFFEKENIDSLGMQSELLLTALSSFAESESRSISKNQKWGVQKRFEDGTYICSFTPFGYRNVKGKMIVEKSEAEIVQRIFKMCLDGYGVHKISKILESEEIHGVKGTKWHSSTILGFLQNVNYTGDLLLQKTYRDENYVHHTNRGELQQYLVKNHHEAIIDKETFDAAQTAMEKRRCLSGIKKGTNHLDKMTALSGILICGDCGSKFKQLTQKNYHAWHCAGRVKDVHSCSILSIKDEAIKTAILKSMRKLNLAHEQVLVPYLETIKRPIDENALKKVECLEDEIAKIQDQQNTLLILLTNNVIDSNIYHQQRAELEAQKNQDLKQLNLINKSDNEITELVIATEALIKDVSKKKGMDVDDYISKHIETITIKDRNNIVLNMKCGLRFKERIDRPW